MFRDLRRMISINRDKKDYERNAHVNIDKVVKLKRKNPSFSQNLHHYFFEFSSKSSIHGFKYLGEQKRSIVEKLWWTVVFMVSLYTCSYVILKTYEKWQNSPVIISFAKSPTPIWKIPFPAVTVCAETKAKKAILNFTDLYLINRDGNLTIDQRWKIEQAGMVCHSHLHPEGNLTMSYDAIDYLAKIAPTLNEMFHECKWMKKIINCSELFTPILTEEGICFTFNMLDRDEFYTNVVYKNRDYFKHGVKSTNWSLEDGYQGIVGMKTYPRRAQAAGQDAGLSLILKLQNKDLDYICRGPVQGFKVVLHPPSEVPRAGERYVRVPLNKEVTVSMKPDLMTTSDILKSYPVRLRECYFHSDRQLRFYKVYTQQNCEVECLANFTMRQCGCVVYHMLHDDNATLCGTGSINCLIDAQDKLIVKELENSLRNVAQRDTDSRTENFDCNCLPTCTSLSYNTEHSQADSNWTEFLRANNIYSKNLNGSALAGVTLFFKEMQFITSERNELYGKTDFVSKSGGLLALFMGFSLLSIIEILYFLTLRLVGNIKNYGRGFWSGDPDLSENIMLQ